MYVCECVRVCESVCPPAIQLKNETAPEFARLLFVICYFPISDGVLLWFVSVIIEV